jgi:hypothetical protein
VRPYLVLLRQGLIPRLRRRWFRLNRNAPAPSGSCGFRTDCRRDRGRTRLALPQQSNAADSGKQIVALRTATVTTGPVVHTLRLTGTTGAEKYSSLVSPQLRGNRGGGGGRDGQFRQGGGGGGGAVAIQSNARGGGGGGGG